MHFNKRLPSVGSVKGVPDPLAGALALGQRKGGHDGCWGRRWEQERGWDDRMVKSKRCKLLGYCSMAV